MGRCCIFRSIIPRQFNYFCSRPYFEFQIDGIFGDTSDGQPVLEAIWKRLPGKHFEKHLL